ncbi:MAG: DUF4375 domain-containing protein [Sphingobacteriales bacterium]|nr:MAG: DUF4375 domain-containing protein [Sphingobacteriales bacterium]
MNLKQFDDISLIDHVYLQMAGNVVRDGVTDWSDFRQWKAAVASMPEPVQTTYRIGVLNIQVMNGGFIQYFDNGYGIFALDTLADYDKIQEPEYGIFLKKAIEVINTKNLGGDELAQYVYFHQYRSVQNRIAERLELIDDEYYAANSESLEKSWANYLRRSL